MALLTIPNVKIVGISACVPALVEENLQLPIFRDGEASRVILSTGIERKRVVEPGTTSSDLCVKSALKLLSELGWNTDEVDCLIFVSSSRDFITPPTSCILQDRLKLRQDCYTVDIPCGCPGWLYGLSVIASLLSRGDMKKGLLLVGDTSTIMTSPKDKSSRPLFGDAGTATALQYVEESQNLQFQFGTDGSNYEAILTKEGGYRYPFSSDSLVEKDYGEGIIRRGIDCEMKGMDVFAFSISKAPQSIRALIDHFLIDENNVDYLFLHQANLYMLEKIRKKLKFSPEKVPYCLKDYGNTSCASIPLTIVTQCKNDLTINARNNIACAFGVGLSWGSLYFHTEKIICPELIEY